MLLYFGILILTFIASLLGTYLVRKITLANGWVAHPSADRWHEKPTALHGGVGIFCSFMIGSLALALSFYFGLIDLSLIGLEYGETFYKKFLTILGGVTIIFLVGLIDDIIHLKPGVKLLGEIIAISLVILFGIGYDLTTYPWINLLLSYLWFVGIVNAVNLLDNMDGVSSGVVIIGATGVCLLGIFGYADFTPPSVLIGGLLAISGLGFWIYNKPPASVFMGDSGSLVLGFIFAAITIPSDLNAFYIPSIEFSIWDKVMELLIAIILAAIPILDTTLVTITRLMRGQSPSQGGKDHSTHRLAQSGLTNWQTLKILYSVSLGCALVALVIVIYPQAGFLFFGIVFLSMLIVAFYLASVKIQVDPIKEEGWQQLITSIAYRLPLIKMMMDIIIIALSFHLAYLVRFDFNPNHEMTEDMLRTMPLVILGCLLANFILRIYDFSWKTPKRGDVIIYIPSALLGTLISLSFVAIAHSFGLSYSRGAFVFHFIIYFFAVCATRYSYRFLDEGLLRFRTKQEADGKIPLLVYGNTNETKFFLEDIMQNSGRWEKYKVIGIVDKSCKTDKKKIDDIPIKSPEKWVLNSFTSQPEILLIDDSIDHSAVRDFSKKLGTGIRTRKLVYKILDIT